jgi:hypothetical protein
MPVIIVIIILILKFASKYTFSNGRYLTLELFNFALVRLILGVVVGSRGFRSVAVSNELLAELDVLMQLYTFFFVTTILPLSKSLSLRVRFDHQYSQYLMKTT